MSMQRALLVFLLTVLLVGPVGAYKGSQLSRGPVDSFQLVDHTNETYAFDLDSQGVMVVSFIFTRCPDVCPVITQSLKSVQDELSVRELDDVTFVSITVDPEYDTPERLKDYTELHGVDWPHLTGSVDELEPVWATFGVVVQKAVIEAHVMPYQPGEASVTVLDRNGSGGQHMMTMNATASTALLAQQAGWSLNTSTSSYGTMLNGINGVDSPSDWSWYWELNVWNTTAETWEASQVGMDELDVLNHPHTAWKASSQNSSLLSPPGTEDGWSMQVVWPNGTTELVLGGPFTAYHLTQAALGSASVNTTVQSTEYGHYLTSINDVEAPDDASWWWNLYLWNETTNVWDTSPVGMDDVVEPLHIAWAPSDLNVSELASPVQTNGNASECDGQGWAMGYGEDRHCMCDAGYTWEEDDRMRCVPDRSESYNVGHSTIVYLLNPAREPVVAWAGDDWRPVDVAADVKELLEREELGGYQTEITPNVSFVALLALVAGAAFLRKSPFSRNNG